MGGSKHARNAVAEMTVAGNKYLRTGGSFVLGVLNDRKRGIATGQVVPGNQRQLTGVFGWNSGLLIPCVLGFFLTLLFLLRRNVIIGMAVHALIDGISLILVPMVSTKA